MSFISLCKTSMYAMVDEGDFETLNQYTWYCQKHGRTFRAFRIENASKTNEWKTRTVYMAKAIMKSKKGQVVDHIDGNSLNNRRSNLRLCTQHQKCFNRLPRMGSKSGVTGVKWDRFNKRWKAYVSIKKKRVLVGNYIDKAEAMLARNVAASFAYGEFARI